MKTAMQELIQGIDGSVEILNEIGHNEITVRTLISVKNVAIELIQKEKEQIIKSWHNGYENQSPMIDEDNCGQTYYNETYNKDRITISETKRSIEGIGLLYKNK